MDQTPAQKARREARIDHRSKVSQEHARTRGAVIELGRILLGRSFLGRLKWLFLGR